VELDPEEVRVLACLAEKQLTTPAQYPLTLNALTLACNQSSSRDPIVTYDEATVEAAVTRVKTKGLARFHHPSHGRSALRFGHVLDEHLGLDGQGLAVLTVLMLRGPQTPGELRTRTQRMADFSTPREVEDELERLAARQPPLVRRLGRQPGQKEERYAPLLGRAPAFDPPPRVAEGESEAVQGPAPQAGVEPGAGLAVDRALVGELAELRAEVQALRHVVDDLRAQLGL
jgi:uncharacterized protein